MARRHFPPKGSTAAWSSALRKASHDVETHGPNKGRRRIDLIAERLVEQAMAGDLAAAREIGDRLDGKASQRHDLAGWDGEGPVQSVQRIILRWQGQDEAQES